VFFSVNLDIHILTVDLLAYRQLLEKKLAGDKHSSLFGLFDIGEKCLKS
jgi:hypothetical protein